MYVSILRRLLLETTKILSKFIDWMPVLLLKYWLVTDANIACRDSNPVCNDNIFVVSSRPPAPTQLKLVTRWVYIS